MKNRSEYQKEYFRIAAFLNMLEFKQDNDDLTLFSRPYSTDVISQIEDQEEDEKYHLDGNVIIHLYGDCIQYSHRKFIALETGRLTTLNCNFESKFTFEAFLKCITDIFNDLFGSIEYEFYQAPFYNPSTIMRVTAFKLFGKDTVLESKLNNGPMFV